MIRLRGCKNRRPPTRPLPGTSPSLLVLFLTLVLAFLRPSSAFVLRPSAEAVVTRKPSPFGRGLPPLCARRRPPTRHPSGWGSDGRPAHRSRSPVKNAPVLPPLRTRLILIHAVVYACQLLSVYRYAPVLNAQLLRRGYRKIMSPLQWTKQSVMGGGGLTLPAGYGRAIVSSLGPFTTDFFHYPPHTRYQPHRLLTAGLLHGSGLHLLFNMMYLKRTAPWIEAALGEGLFLTAYLASAVAGNVAAWLLNPRGSCLGASGAICGIDGLAYLLLRRAGRKKEANNVLQGMLYLLLWGMYSPRVSNAGHVGGFLGGLAVAALCGPRFEKNAGRGWGADGRSGGSYRREDEGVADRPTFKKSNLNAMFRLEGVSEISPLLRKRYLWLGMIGTCAILLPTEVVVKMPYYVYLGLRNPGSLGGCIPFLPR